MLCSLTLIFAPVTKRYSKQVFIFAFQESLIFDALYMEVSRTCLSFVVQYISILAPRQMRLRILGVGSTTTTVKSKPRAVRYQLPYLLIASSDDYQYSNGIGVFISLISRFSKSYFTNYQVLALRFLIIAFLTFFPVTKRYSKQMFILI